MNQHVVFDVQLGATPDNIRRIVDRFTAFYDPAKNYELSGTAEEMVIKTEQGVDVGYVSVIPLSPMSSRIQVYCDADQPDAPPEQMDMLDKLGKYLHKMIAG